MPKSRTIGILGGGQLGVMLREAIEALDRSVRVLFVDPDLEAPAHARYPQDAFAFSFDDHEALSRFFETCDVVTFETEHIPIEVLRRVAHTKLCPSLRVLETTQNRAIEKEFIRAQSLPCGDFWVVRDASHLGSVPFDQPYIMKTCLGGYDGKGQARIQSRADAETFIATRPNGPWILEAVIDFSMEVSCIVARTKDGQLSTLGPFENMHIAHILDRTLYPARLSDGLRSKVIDLSIRSACALDIKGLLTVEFFVTGLHVLINEFAPRPHNSGHVTRMACDASQFHLLATILLDAIPKQPTIKDPTQHYCMANLMGDLWMDRPTAQSSDPSSSDARPSGPSSSGLSSLGPSSSSLLEVVEYGKRLPRAKRKMGHLTVCANDDETALLAATSERNVFARALEARAVKPEAPPTQ